MNDALESIKNLGAKKIAILGAAGFVLLIGLIVLALTISSGSLSPLYSNLSLEDSNKIVSELENRNVDYELNANGTQVLVPGADVLRLRMTFAEMGIPASSGSLVGYEIFDKDEKLGTSSFVQNMNQLRALEGELARTISSMQQIKVARVHLVVPKRELFKKDRNEPTGSIQLTMNGSQKLDGGEVAAIRYLVSTAVPGLSVENITVVDSRGILLARGGEGGDDPAMFASNAQEYKANYENQMRIRVEELLEKFVGMGNVKAEVSAEIDFDRTVTNSEIYDPDGQVARSVQTTEESEKAAGGGGGDVSVANNLPGGAAAGAGGGGDSRERIDEVTNFEISKTVKNHISETGKVNKLSVAVLIDGVYAEDAGSGEMVYKARSAEELAKMEELVKSAIGFDEERGDKLQIANLPFSADFGGYVEEGALDWLKQEFQNVVQILVMGLVAILVIMMVVRPLVKRALEVNIAQQAALESQGGGMALLPGPDGAVAQLTPPAGAEGQPAALEGGGIAAGDGAASEGYDALAAISSMGAPGKPASLNKLNEIIETSPDEALSALRTWMYGEEAA